MGEVLLRVLHLSAGTFALAAALSIADPASSETAEQFYRGTTLTVQVGYAPGGGYDIYARTFSRFLGRFLPGNPNVVVQNVPGAGSMRLTNIIANTAPRDGSVIAFIGREQVVAPLYGLPGAKFDATNMNWVGNLDRAASLCVAWHTTSFMTIEDVREREMVVGSTGPASLTTVLPAAMNDVLGYKFKIVSGYPGGNDINLALERGEIQGRCSWSYPSIMSTRPDWVSKKIIRLLAVAAFERPPETPDVPTVLELARSDKERQILELIISSDIMARPLVAPPGVPADRLAALRNAFKTVVRDPEFLAQAKQAKLELNPMDSQEMTATIKRLYATPKSVVDAAIAIVKRAGSSTR
jgi:tripartite-type tricarboxylate transporter receptor subunit TctC